MFIELLTFSSSLPPVANASDGPKCLSLNDKPCMVRPTLIDLHLIELKYYLFMISLDKFNGNCNALSPKICVPKKIKRHK